MNKKKIHVQTWISMYTTQSTAIENYYQIIIHTL